MIESFNFSLHLSSAHQYTIFRNFVNGGGPVFLNFSQKILKFVIFDSFLSQNAEFCNPLSFSNLTVELD